MKSPVFMLISYMSKSKLILLEGIPGSGKTTAGLNLQALLEQKDLQSNFGAKGILTTPLISKEWLA